MRSDEGIDQDLIDRYRSLTRLGVLEPAQGRSTRQRFISAGGYLMNRVVAKRLRVVQVLPTGAQGEHALTQQTRRIVRHLAGLAFVAQHARYLSGQAELLVHLTHQQ